MVSLLVRLLAASGLLLVASMPARSVEWIYLQGPLGLQRLSVRLSELASPEALWEGDSDLAQLNRATDGRYARALETLLSSPLPLQQELDNPMVQQLELLLKSLVQPRSNPLPEAAAAATTTTSSLPVLRRLASSGVPITLMSVLQAMPGNERTIRLDQALPLLRRMSAQHDEVDQLLATLQAMPSANQESLSSGSLKVQRRTLQLASGLEVTLVRPLGVPRLPTVVISHGLWDAPESFLGWADHLASHGAVVLLPRHRGSDIDQQAAMLAGLVPPPEPQEFLRRPREIKLVLDALEARDLPGVADAPVRDVVLIGHSWGATTALQLAGARSLPAPIWRACEGLEDSSRNPSWVLQCSLIQAATDQSLLDGRLSRVVAVSPPQALVFAAGLQDLSIPVLVVSGSRDLVVPAQPEAVAPFRAYPGDRHRLVLVQDGTHFNLPSPAGADGGPLRALLLDWLEEQPISAASAVSDPSGLRLFSVR